MRRHIPRLGLLAILLCLVAAFAYGRPVAPRAQSRPQEPMIPAPDKWVPFTAKLTMRTTSGQTRFGHVYRASDGSSRSDTGPSPEKMTVIAIKNIPRTTFYLWSRGQWTEQPMELPPGGWKPQSFPARLAIHPPEKVEGFDVVRKESQNSTTLFAPQLNFYPLVVIFKVCPADLPECSERLSEIRLEEPPAELFLPPTDVSLTPLDEPGVNVKVR
jgi:hypothetical protein